MLNSIVTRPPLLLFTGGMDSTLLLQNALRRGDCDLLYVNVGQSKEIRAKETVARSAVIALLTSEESGLKGKVGEQFEVTMPDINAEHSAELSRATKLVMAANSVMDAQRHGKVIIGGIKGEEAITNRDRLGKLWQSLNTLTKWKPVPLEFPLAQDSKREVLTALSEELCSLTTVCEASSKEPCRVCSSCKTLAQAYAEYRRVGEANYA